MKAIDVAILNKALAHPGLLTGGELRYVHKIDQRRRENPYVRLNFNERTFLKKIGREKLSIYAESFVPPNVESSGIEQDLENREKDLGAGMVTRSRGVRQKWRL